MAKNLVIVESPAKAKTLKKFLGATYKIEASLGHVRDLPKSELGVNPENDFDPKYITIRGKGELLKKLRKEVKKADKIYLATDPDREGEAISWHLLYALKLDENKALRITFNEITKTAVKKSIKEAREIDMNLVNAQQARRVLDRIMGYKMSPILWKKVKKGLSAGRVQSVLLKLICDREDEIEAFIKEEYWSIECLLKAEQKIFTAKFYGDENGKLDINNEKEATEIIDAISKSKFKVVETKKSSRNKKPQPPFTTSTLQQVSSRILGFPSSKTMQVAQQLYEGVDVAGHGTIGLVSYIRTDSVRVSDEAFEDAKKYILENHGEEYALKEKAAYKSKGRTQDAHEAIRPTYAHLSPDSIKDSLSKEQYKLYKLIWERFISSQMTNAVYETVSARISADKYIFRSSGSILKFDGYLAVYKKIEEVKDEDVFMPELKENQIVKLDKPIKEQHFTQPPPRYSEALIIKTLEELGIGRPSTYAPTISTVLYRGYVTKDNKIFYPTELGEIVNHMLSDSFKEIINVDFTAQLEEKLDKIEEGKAEWKDIIREFYFPFDKQVEEAFENIDQVELEDEVTDVICDKCGRNMVVKMSKYGKFLACPGYPECRNARPFFEDAHVNCPKCGGKIFIKKTKKGRKFYGCENEEDCKFSSWSKPTGENCPECNEHLILKGGKKQRIVCSNPDCGFMKEIPDQEQ